MIEVLKQALEAWQTSVYGSDKHHKAMLLAMTKMNQAIAELESQEPVAWVCCGSGEKHDIDFYEDDVNALPVGTMLYTHQLQLEQNFCTRCGKRTNDIHTCTPPQSTWVGLTDDEIEEGIKQSWVTEQAFQSAAWWAEAKLKEKNNG
jgi:hypothetical protein